MRRIDEIIVHCTATPQGMAVTVCGLLTWYAQAIGHVVEVEYINSVFQFEKRGFKCYGNDIYATSIREVA